MHSINQDTLKRYQNVLTSGWKKAAETFLSQAGQEIKTNSLQPEICPPSELFDKLAEPQYSIQFAFSSAPNRYHLWLISAEDTVKFASVVTGQEFADFSDGLAEYLSPLLTPILDVMVMELANVSGISYAPLDAAASTQPVTLPPNFLQQDEIVKAVTECTLGDATFSIVWLIDGDTFGTLISPIEPIEGMEQASANAFEEINMPSDSAQFASGFASSPSPALEAPQEDTGIELLLDIPLDVSVELGRVRMFIRDVVDFGPGTIVELDKTVGEPVEVLVNGRVVARGEVVVLEDNFGVRITEILSQMERLQRVAEKD